MFSSFKNRLFHLLQVSSHPLNLPLPFIFLLELVSYLQILSLVLLPILTETNLSGQDHLSKTLSNLFLYTKPFKILDPFQSESGPDILITLCGIYLIALFIGIAFVFYQITHRNMINWSSKVLSLMLLLHSKVLFFSIHCFLIKTLDYNVNNDSVIFKGNPSLWIFLSIFFLIFNLALAIFKKVFCFQLHKIHDTYGMKDSWYGLNILAHKFLTIILYYFIPSSPDPVIVFNIIFTLIGLIILHKNLPFYNLKVLKLNVILATIVSWISLFSFVEIFDRKNKNILLIIFFTIGFAIKISLIFLNWTFQNILNLRKLTPYKAAHLPILIREYQKKASLTKFQDKTNKETLYSLGFQKGNNESEEEIYSIIVKEMMEISQQKEGKELLTLCIAQIYIEIFADAVKAMIILSKLNENVMTIIGRISYRALSKELEALNYQHAAKKNEDGSSRNSLSHLDYFIYKEKTLTLKEYIKTEIHQHQTFWKLVSGNIIEALPVIFQGSLISSSTGKISRYWNKNFQDNELIFVNASIMYGLYLKTLQSLPSGGAALVRKAFTALNNKQHVYRDVIDVVLGNKAVLIASIEPDKIGKIIDTSSSVNKIFKTNKKNLIGMNIGMLMPSVIAEKHNDLVRQYHKNSTQGLNRVVNTYAKTITDQYFNAELTLRIAPGTENGLNVVAFVEKTSEYYSIIVVDHDGNIVEASSDLGNLLNITTKKSSYLKIDMICKELGRIHTAWNMMTFPEGNEEQEIVDQRFTQDHVKPNNQIHKETLISARSSRTSRRLLSMENELTTDRNNPETERPLSMERMTITMSKEEAAIICEIFKSGWRDLEFLPLNSQKVTLNNKSQELRRYKTEIEPFILQGKLYKILKIKDLTPNDTISLPKPSFSYVPSTASKLEKSPNDQLVPEETERGERAKEHKCSIEPSFGLRFMPVLPRLSHISFTPTKIEPTKEEIPLSETVDSNKSKKKTLKAQSLVTSQFSNQATAQQFNTSLKIEKQSPEIRLAVNMVYLAVIIIAGSILVDLIYTSKSLQNMSDSISLVGLVNGRLGKTILAWHNVMALYARSIGFRKIDARLPFNQALALNATMDMLTNGQALLQKVDDFGREDVSRIFYEKSIAFWEPLTHSPFENEKVDSFTANSILIDYNLEIIRYNGSLLDFNGSRTALFTINNTANDYILSIDRTIEEISEFFEDTLSDNISLLKVIISLETLFIIIPFALTIYILVATIKLYKQLFHAICKIHAHSLTWRMKQLDHMALLFDENIDDDISYFNDLKAKKVIPEKTSNGSRHISKIYREQSLIIYGIKYIILACGLTGLIIGLIANSFKTSVNSFYELDVLKHQISETSALSSKVKMAFPAFYVAAMFANDTTIKIRNQDPAEVLVASVDAIGGANAELLEAVTSENNEVEDPVINQLLRGKVCGFVSDVYYANCLLNTNDEALGLLGLQPKVWIVMGFLREWAHEDNPTLASAGKALDKLVVVMKDLHFVIFELYDFLGEHLIESYVKKAEEEKKGVVKVFYMNIMVMLVTMGLIRVIVLRKLQELDVGVRRILRIIPYRIIEENKVMGFYLVKAFGNELEVLKLLR